jgi:protein-tyrosine phosphatase
MKLVETSLGILYIGDKDDVLMLVEKMPKITFDIIWNLAEELEFLVTDEKRYATQVLFANIEDYNTPDNYIEFHQQLALVVNTLRIGGKAFIHCFGGHGRTGLALAAIKVMLDKLTAKEALAFADTHCDGPETDDQKQYIRTLGK